MSDGPLRMTQAGDAIPFEIPGATGEFRIQILNEDRGRGVVTSIVHLPAGGTIPAHHHDAGSEMHYVLEGDLIEAGEPLAVGAFLTHAKGVVHGPHESRGGARVLTVQTWQSEGGSFDFHPAEGGAADASGGSGSGSAADSAGDLTATVNVEGSGPSVAEPSGGQVPVAGAPRSGPTGEPVTQEEAAKERGANKGYS